MPDLSDIQMMLDEGPAFLAEYNSKRSSLQDYTGLIKAGEELSASERVMLEDWITNLGEYLVDNLEKFQKLEGLSRLTIEQLETLKKECEECQIPLE